MTQNSNVFPTNKATTAPDLAQVHYSLKQQIKKELNCCRPGIIIDFNEENATATVQIAQQQVLAVSPAGVKTLAPYAQLEAVPVYVMGGGLACATFPIAAGDGCSILFCDREIDNWLAQGGANSSPTSSRLHDFSDAICLVGLRPYPQALAGYSTNSAQLRSNDGETVIDLNPTSQVVTVTAPGGTQVISDMTVTGNLNIEGNSGADTAIIGCNLTQTTGKVLKAGNGATGTFATVVVENGIVVSGS